MSNEQTTTTEFNKPAESNQAPARGVQFTDQDKIRIQVECRKAVCSPK